MTETPEGPSSPQPPAPRPPEEGAGSASRRLSDAEASEVLRRAAAVELRPGAADGASLVELMAAAREAGLDPAEVRRAAALAPVAESGAVRMLLGAPDRREQRAFLPDTAFPASADAVVRTVEEALGTAGQVVESSEHRLIWRARDGSATLELVGSAEGVSLRLGADRARRYFAHWFAGFAAWALLAAFTPVGAALGVPATLVGFVVAPPLLARPLWVRSDRAARLRLEHAAMDVLRTVEGV